MAKPIDLGSEAWWAALVTVLPDERRVGFWDMAAGAAMESSGKMWETIPQLVQMIREDKAIKRGDIDARDVFTPRPPPQAPLPQAPPYGAYPPPAYGYGGYPQPYGPPPWGAPTVAPAPPQGGQAPAEPPAWLSQLLAAIPRGDRGDGGIVDADSSVQKVGACCDGCALRQSVAGAVTRPHRRYGW
jgi:hypothetical protein